MAFFLLSSLLVGCAERTSAPFATSIPTVDPQLMSEDCSRPALENWLQRSSNLTQELAETINGNIAIQPDRATEVLDQLGSIEAALVIARAPQCAQAHAEALNEAIRLAADYFSAYRQGRVADPVGALTRINGVLDQARTLEQELMQLYEVLVP
ncbi:MAG: hypothetical protein CUN49_10875 [Candidatus Thermofonsia Clade 1 bacterium]|jgi:hypothetical protein|uniref:Uncharacterized protein n=1 Tax=Candidatus Thermofonsia Clade 1 bacterium TaxID=2364210 RepID=A0A2M8PCV9_9CHLR|nr:MAG: hypothetical protein CUN49_10875 [Candidatus Thermofonsia Clade 1 bacterium]RMF50555.1 MAG: hypothetical protein D6749_10310 [Chloroflexota bacterium]